MIIDHHNQNDLCFHQQRDQTFPKSKWVIGPSLSDSGAFSHQSSLCPR